MKKEEVFDEEKLKENIDLAKTGIIAGAGVAGMGAISGALNKASDVILDYAKKSGVSPEKLLVSPVEKKRILKKASLPLLIGGTVISGVSAKKNKDLKKKLQEYREKKEQEERSKEEEKQFAAVPGGQSASVIAERLRYNRTLMQQRFKQVQLAQKEKLSEASRLSSMQNSMRLMKNQQNSQRLKLRGIIEDQNNPAVKNWRMVKNETKPVPPVSMK